LKKVLSNAQKHVDDLEAHIKQGEKLLEEKEDAIDEISSKVATTNVGDVEAAKTIKRAQEQKSKSMEQAQQKALEDPAKTGEDLSKAELKKRAKAAEEEIVKTKEKAEELNEEIDSLKPEVAKAEEQLKTLQNVQKQSSAQEGS
jgi:chromosome segregation ATPase